MMAEWYEDKAKRKATMAAAAAQGANRAARRKVLAQIKKAQRKAK